MKFKGNVTYLEGKLLIPILVEMYFFSSSSIQELT